MTTLRLDDGGAAEHRWKLDVIRPILAAPVGSPERKAEYLKLAGIRKTGWLGKPVKLALSTLYLWVRTYEANGGLNLCLAKRVRADKGKKAARISRQWQRAVPFDAAVCEQIESDLRQYLRGLILDGAQRKIALVLCGEELRAMSAAHGFEVSDAYAKAIFTLPITFWRAEKHFQKVYRHKVDRKGSEDAKPRIRRTTKGMVPMEVVVMDVHHINVLVRRENGTNATAKLLAFHDLATYRVYCEIVLFEEKGGVRNADIIQAFVNMCRDPAYGVPQYLYVDNGSEYGFADDLNDALKLGTKVIGFNDLDERRRVIRAKPYNAAAKHVEGWFGQMNRQYFRLIKGWIDDDRMNPKRPELGKLPDPFDRGFDAFVQQVRDLLHAYEVMPQRGALDGQSPAETFRGHVEAGWKATLLDPTELLSVFTRADTRVVRNHGIDVDGRAYTCDGLLRFMGNKVTVHIPKYFGYQELLITDDKGNEIGIAVADEPFHVLDQRGAKESARRTSVRNKELTRLKKSVPTIDVLHELAAHAAKQMPVVPNEPDGVISLNRGGSSKRAILPVPAKKNSRAAAEEEARLIDEARAAALGWNTERKAQ
ncbi:hypothetical protein ACFFP0_24260 [Rhizobium puerariae]|uniref:Integrase catalytic domain-containing protein n=1 Tax=Rhizobium puerariae TaxID=1585791 RepID=A0ABV6AMY7_9HYPH